MNLKSKIIKSKIDDLSKRLNMYNKDEIKKAGETLNLNITENEKKLIESFKNKSLDEVCEWLSSQIEPYEIDKISSEIEKLLIN